MPGTAQFPDRVSNYHLGDSCVECRAAFSSELAQMQAAIHQDGFARHKCGPFDKPDGYFRDIVRTGGFWKRYGLFVTAFEFGIVFLAEARQMPACFDQSRTNRINAYVRCQ